MLIKYLLIYNVTVHANNILKMYKDILLSREFFCIRLLNLQFDYKRMCYHHRDFPICLMFYVCPLLRHDPGCIFLCLEFKDFN